MMRNLDYNNYTKSAFRNSFNKMLSCRVSYSLVMMSYKLSASFAKMPLPRLKRIANWGRINCTLKISVTSLRRTFTWTNASRLRRGSTKRMTRYYNSKRNLQEKKTKLIWERKLSTRWVTVWWSMRTIAESLLRSWSWWKTKLWKMMLARVLEESLPQFVSVWWNSCKWHQFQ